MTKLVVSAAAAVVLGIALATTPTAAQTVKIGFIATFSGPGGTIGTHLYDGFMLGIEHAGGSEPYVEVPWMWSDQYDVNLQVAGLPAAVDASVRRGTDDKFTVIQLNDGAVVGAVTVNQGRDMRPLQQLIAKAAKVDVERLADPAVPLAQIAKGA